MAATGLARYKLAIGRFPENLSELVPGYLPRIPHDWYDGQPLKYRRLEDGSFLLYSVGGDLRDNGGDPSGYLLLHGADIVWPQAAVPKTSGTEVEKSGHP